MSQLQRTAAAAQRPLTPREPILKLAPASILRFCTMAELSAGSGDETMRTCAELAHWVRSYLMRPHPDLGRPGPVCPFTNGADRLNLIRIACSASSDDIGVGAAMREALAAFAALQCQKTQRHFRTVIVAFPHCAGAEGIAVLSRTQNRLRPLSIFGGKMIGLFEPQSQAAGLINPDFRPLRSPVPALAIRMLVANDAPFVLRNPLLAPLYLAKFPLTGTAKLLRLLWA